MITLTKKQFKEMLGDYYIKRVSINTYKLEIGDEEPIMMRLQLEPSIFFITVGSLTMKTTRFTMQEFEYFTRLGIGREGKLFPMTKEEIIKCRNQYKYNRPFKCNACKDLNRCTKINKKLS